MRNPFRLYKFILVEVALPILLVVSLGAIVLYVPIPSVAGLWARYGFETLLIPLFALLYLGICGKSLSKKIIGLCLTLALFGLGLSGLWSSAASEMQVAAGGLFFSDAFYYLADANRLLATGSISPFAMRHPFSTGLLASFLAIFGHNLQLALAALVLIVALACFWATWEIKNSLGAAPAVLFLLFLWVFYRRFSGLIDSENLGLAFGAIGFALMWAGAGKRSQKLVWPGLFFISMGLNTRPGAFFVLPALIFWSAAVFGKEGKHAYLKSMVIGVMVGLSGFLLNLGVAALTGSQNGALFSNFASTFYGITHGGLGWEAVYQQHPEITHLPELAATLKILQLSFRQILTQPLLTLKAVAENYGRYFSVRDESLFGFFSGSELTFFNLVDRQRQGLYIAIRAICLLLSLVTVIYAWRRRAQPLPGLLLFGLAGLLLSLPFIPAQDAALMRVFAATLPLIAIFPVYGLYLAIRYFRKEHSLIQDEITETRFVLPLVLGIGLALAAVGGPILMHALPPRVAPSELACPAPGIEKYVRISPGSYLRIVPDQALAQTWLPNIRTSDYQRSLATFQHPQDIADLRSLSFNTAVMNAFDLKNLDAFWMIIDSHLLPPRDGVYILCGQWDAGKHAHGLPYYYVHAILGEINPGP